MLIYSPVHFYAEAPSNVLDCLNDEDCLEFEQNEEDEKQNTNENNLLENNKANTDSLIINFLKMIVALLLVLAIIYLFVKLIGRKKNISHRTKSLENMGGISVGQQKSIQVIRVGRRFYLIGVGDNVELLQEITDADMIEDLLDEMNESDDSVTSIFSSFFQKNKKNEQDEGDSNNFKQQLKSELDKIKQQRRRFIDQSTEKEDRYD